MKPRHLALAAVVPLALLAAAPMSSAAGGGQLSGAIFTTDVTGAPVNLNHYLLKTDVYLNGGPGINAPASAAGLPADTYTFQVTSPNGRTVLSQDALACRSWAKSARVADRARERAAEGWRRKARVGPHTTPARRRKTRVFREKSARFAGQD